MSEPSPPAPRRRPPAFRPRFTVGLFYLVVFFFLFSLLQVLPDLLALLASMPPGAEQQRAAQETARSGANPLAAAILSLLTTALGSHFQVLPGMREG